MPKVKTHKGAAARFHISGNGKVLHTKGPKSHFRRRKAKRLKRLFGIKTELDSATFSKRIKALLGGSKFSR